MKTKHLLNGVAVIAALALSPPVWAQPANPSGGNSRPAMIARTLAGPPRTRFSLKRPGLASV